MTATERLQQRLNAMPAEEREAWAAYALQQIEQQRDQADPWDDLTPEEFERVKARIQEGINAAEHGDVSDWNLEEFLAEATKHHQSAS